MRIIKFDSSIKTDMSFFKRVRRGEIVTPITPWEKQYYYGWNFIKKYGKRWSYHRKLKALIKMAQINIGIKRTKRISEVEWYKRRRVRRHRTNKLCFVCKKRRARYFHHIIQLIHGGYDNSLNRIPICHWCHVKIHPWMQEQERIKNESHKIKA